MLSSTDENSCDLDSFGRIPRLCTKLSENTYRVSQKHRTVSRHLLLATGCYLLRCSAYNKSKPKFTHWFKQTQHNRQCSINSHAQHTTAKPSIFSSGIRQLPVLKHQMSWLLPSPPLLKTKLLSRVEQSSCSCENQKPRISRLSLRFSISPSTGLLPLQSCVW